MQCSPICPCFSKWRRRHRVRLKKAERTTEWPQSFGYLVGKRLSRPCRKSSRGGRQRSTRRANQDRSTTECAAESGGLVTACCSTRYTPSNADLLDSSGEGRSPDRVVARRLFIGSPCQELLLIDLRRGTDGPWQVIGGSGWFGVLFMGRQPHDDSVRSPPHPETHKYEFLYGDYRPGRRDTSR